MKKIVFANPPVIRSDKSCPQNDFKLDGILLRNPWRKFWGLPKLWNLFGLDGSIRCGVRAGSRWPWTKNYISRSPHYPFTMGYAASYLKTHGYDVVLLDAIVDGIYSYDIFLKKIQEESPDIVILECSSPTIDIDIWFANKVSKFSEACLAGPHLTSFAEKIANDNPDIKYFLKGEYILSSLDLVRDQRAGIYEVSVLKDLDSVPFPHRDFSGVLNYFDPSMPTQRPQLQIYASKGCPFYCTYCMWPATMYMRHYSPRDPKKVAAEIKYCVSRYGFKSIFFDDDTFNINNERIRLLCYELRDIGLPWTMMGRLDTSPAEIFDEMVDCGCVGMRFGVETFDAQVSRNVRKGLRTEKIIPVLEHITRKHPELMIHLTMMKDMPGQTDEIHKRDINVLQSLGYSVNNAHRSYQLSTCVPFPGTELYNGLRDKIPSEISQNFKKYDGSRDTIISLEEGKF